MDGSMFRGWFSAVLLFMVLVGVVGGIALWELVWWLARHVSIGWN